MSYTQIAAYRAFEIWHDPSSGAFRAYYGGLDGTHTHDFVERIKDRAVAIEFAKAWIDRYKKR